jgi:large subunit ribosomal protein L17
MFRNMVTSLFKYDRIRTTDAKAKELRRWADQLITLAKRGDLHARRQAMAILREKEVVHKLFEQAADRFGAVAGGYTRIVKLGRRPGDAAAVSLVELIAIESAGKKKKGKKRKAAAGTTKKKPAAAKKTTAGRAKADQKTGDESVSATEAGSDPGTDKAKQPEIKKTPAGTSGKKASTSEPKTPEDAPASGKETAGKKDGRKAVGKSETTPKSAAGKKSTAQTPSGDQDKAVDKK